MRAYAISRLTDGKPLGFGGSQAHAREVRDLLIEQSNGELRKKDLQIVEEEVPTGKAELLVFINTLLGAA